MYFNVSKICINESDLKEGINFFKFVEELDSQGVDYQVNEANLLENAVIEVKVSPHVTDSAITNVVRKYCTQVTLCLV